MSTVFVTGASSGFGRLACEALARRGHLVFAGIRDLAERRGAFADLIAAGDVRLVPLDVRSDESVDAAFELARREADGLDALVDNAGVALFGLVEETSPAALSAILETNLVGALRVVRGALPLLRRRAPGSCMIHVSSGLARVVLPGVGGYTATKAALEALAEALAYEVRPIGVESTILQPGSYRTALLRKATIAEDGRARSYGALAELPRRMAEHAPTGDPRDVAAAIVALVEASPGTRPLRRVLDPVYGERIERLNAAHASAQKELLSAIGLGHLAG